MDSNHCISILIPEVITLSYILEISCRDSYVFAKIPLKEVVLETHIKHSNKSSLQQPHQHVAPVVLVIRDSGVTHIYRKGHQEELDGGSEKSGPLSRQSRLNVKLEGETEWKQRVVDCGGFGGEKTEKREIRRRDSVFMQGFLSVVTVNLPLTLKKEVISGFGPLRGCHTIFVIYIMLYK